MNLDLKYIKKDLIKFLNDQVLKRYRSRGTQDSWLLNSIVNSTHLLIPRENIQGLEKDLIYNFVKLPLNSILVSFNSQHIKLENNIKIGYCLINQYSDSTSIVTLCEIRNNLGLSNFLYQQGNGPRTYLEGDNGDFTKQEVETLWKAGANLLNLISYFLIDKEYVRENTVKQKLPRSFGSKPNKLVFSDVIYYKPPREVQIKNYQELTGNHIDFSHRFEVMGHWRRCNRIGLDQYGNRTEIGRTWVNQFVKGPEDKPLIKKTRAIDTFQSTH